MNLDKITELELQAAGLEKQWWTFGFGNPIYKDAHNTYMVNKDSGKVFHEYRHNEVKKYEF